MKKRLYAIGKAALWVAAYFMIQFAVGAVFTVSSLGAASKALDGNFSFEAVNALLLELVLEQTNLIYLIANALFLIIMGVYFAIRKRSSLHALSIRGVRPLWLLPVVFGALAAAFALVFVLGLLPIPESVWENYEKAASATQKGNRIIAFIAVVIVAPLAEECLFRGLVFTGLEKAMPTFPALLASSLIFGAAHVDPVWIAYASLLGLLMTLIFIWSGSCLPTYSSIWPSILWAHS